jgi:lipopolysaccharide/colanic/teichoic acid biosynthesis glycosyltransferase
MNAYEGAKRSFDIVLASLLLIVLAPVLLVTGAAIVIDSGLPILYSGRRVGKNGRAFFMHKFRTMVADAESRGGSSTPADDPRITRVGRYLRRQKLDE